MTAGLDTRVALRPSPIADIGVFALVALHAGEVICDFRYEREVTPAAPLRPELGELPEHCPVIDGRVFLVAAPERYLNHSCDPNAYLRFDQDGMRVVALREISVDGEVTLDYLINNEGGDSWVCSCGTARCRGETGVSFFTLPLKIQREYLPLLAPWFRERHAEKLKHLAAS